MKRIAWFAAALWGAVGPALAHSTGTSVVLSHGGRLLGDSDVGLDGSHQLSFTIFRYAAPPPEGADEAFWSETYTVTLFRGVYQVDLGRTATSGEYAGKLAIPDSAFDGGDRYLQIAVNGQPLSPRLRIGTVPYAQRAATAEHAEHADFATAAGDATTLDGTAASLFALKSDLKDWALKSELQNWALASDLQSYALKTDIKDWALKSELKDWVEAGGDTMTGNLSITAAPTDATHAVTKGWVENELSNYVQGSSNNINAASLGNFPAADYYRIGQPFRLPLMPNGFVCNASTLGTIWRDATSGALRVCTTGNDGQTQGTAARSCQAIVDAGFPAANGPYWIDADGTGPLPAIRTVCDFQSGLGWTRVIHAVQATSGAVRVNQATALAGSADPSGSGVVWVGVEHWKSLLAAGKLRVTCSGGNSGTRDVTGDFNINPSDNYRISYTSSTSSCFATHHNGFALTTTDFDRDAYSNNCAVYGGAESTGWGWHNTCHCGSPWIGDTLEASCVVASSYGNVSRTTTSDWYLR
jgi:hypothetical protein